MSSPFDFKNNKLLYISEDMPFPDNKDKRYIEAVADEIERLVIASHGHAAVLFTSYNAIPAFCIGSAGKNRTQRLSEGNKICPSRQHRTKL